ncbi:MAG: hypothetical protein ACYC7L_11430 [Nitrospirota bacterium]
MHEMSNTSVIGRLLEELSWVGATIRDYRNGGRGYENVLTAEALQALDYLPRAAFLGAVIQAAHGAEAARQQLINEIEQAEVMLLPGNHYLGPPERQKKIDLAVQPDGIITTPNCYVLLEAKRIRSSSFQQDQLARELVLALQEAGHRKPMLFLVLGEEPPVKVQRRGRLSIAAAVDRSLAAVIDKSELSSINISAVRSMISDMVFWITWNEIKKIVEYQAKASYSQDPSVRMCIERLTRSVSQAIQWHS